MSASTRLVVEDGLESDGLEKEQIVRHEMRCRALIYHRVGVVAAGTALLCLGHNESVADVRGIHAKLSVHRPGHHKRQVRA